MTATLPKLDRAGFGGDESAMGTRRAQRRRLVVPRLSYTTRVHLKRRMRAIDVKFVVAVGLLVAATVGMLRFL